MKELARSYLPHLRSHAGDDAYQNDLPKLGHSLEQQVYALGHRAEWLAKLSQAGVRRQAEFFYQQSDAPAPAETRPGTGRQSLNKEREWKDGDRGGLAERQKREKNSWKEENTLDRDWPSPSKISRFMQGSRGAEA